MSSVLWLVLGAVLGLGVIALARRGGTARERRFFGVGLVVAAAIYVLFAGVGGSTSGLLTEAIGLGVFGIVALIGWRFWPLLLVIGWSLHVGWDVGLHLVTPAPYIGTWYPLMCISFDLLVAGYLVGSLRHATSPAHPQ